MIQYGSGAFGLRILFRIHGSAVYKSFFPCLLSSIIFVVLFQNFRLQDDGHELFLHPYPMGALISALTFLLTFRANFSYNRYWESVTAVQQMHSKWLDVGTTIAAFHLQSSIYDRRKPPAFGSYPQINGLERARERLNETTLEELGDQLDELADKIAEEDMTRSQPPPLLVQKSKNLLKGHRKTKSWQLPILALHDQSGSSNSNGIAKPNLVSRTRSVQTPIGRNGGGGGGAMSTNSVPRPRLVSRTKSVQLPVLYDDISHSFTGNTLAGLMPPTTTTEIERDIPNQTPNQNDKDGISNSSSVKFQIKEPVPDDTPVVQPQQSSDKPAMEKILQPSAHHPVLQNAQQPIVKKSINAVPPPITNPIANLEKQTTSSKHRSLSFTKLFIPRSNSNVNIQHGTTSSDSLPSNSSATTTSTSIPKLGDMEAATANHIPAWDYDKPPLFLQEIAHLLSLLSAVAFSTLRNDLEQADSPLITFVPNAPWPHVDPDAYTADVRKDWDTTEHRTIAVIRYVSGWSRTKKSRTLYNAARPFRVIGGVSDAEIELLQAARGPLAKVALVSMWLQEFMVRECLAGSTGNVAAPILARLYQYVSDGMMGYHQAHKVAYIPFPFPHAQITSLFVLIVGALMPVLMLSYLTNAAFGFVLNLFTVMCFVGLHEVAREMENPFQNVPNDIPLNNFQAQYNEALMGMFTGYHPDAFWEVVHKEKEVLVGTNNKSGPDAANVEQ